MALFNRFARYALRYDEKSMVDIYNSFLQNEKLTDAERKFISDNYILMIKVGESSRKAIPSIKKILD